MHFGPLRTPLPSLIIGLAVGARACAIRDFADSTRKAIAISHIALPAGALVFYGVELLSALGSEASALALIRPGVPAMTIAFIGIVFLSSLPISSPMAVTCWGSACALVMALVAYEARRMAPPRLFRAVPIEQAVAWLKGSQPFLIYRISLALLAQAGVLALDWLQPSRAWRTANWR